MNVLISTRQLRASLPDIVRRVRKGARFTVLYRSRAAFQIVPAEESVVGEVAFEDDPLYRAEPVGSSSDGRTASQHDGDLYRMIGSYKA